MSVYVVGAGNVGLGLALALQDWGLRIGGIYNRSPQRAATARALFDAAVEVDVGGFGRRLDEADLVLVCVSDHAITEVGGKLLASGRLGPGVIVGHTSGCLASSAFGSMPEQHLGSLHPLVACPDPERTRQALLRANWAVEGAPEAVSTLRRLAEALQGRVVELRAADKSRYHAAAVLASNLVVSLLADANDEATAVGMTGATAPLVDLALGALDSVKHLGLVDGLTGPVRRGDVETIRRHLDVLRGDTRDLYIRLSRRALRLAREAGLPAAAAEAVGALLDEQS